MGLLDWLNDGSSDCNVLIGRMSLVELCVFLGLSVCVWLMVCVERGLY